MKVMDKFVINPLQYLSYKIFLIGKERAWYVLLLHWKISTQNCKVRKVLNVMIASLPEVPEYCRHKNTLEHSGYVQQKAHILPSLTMNDVHDTYFVILQLKIYIPMR